VRKTHYSLTQKIEFILIVRDLNQVNSSIKIENFDGFMPQDRDGSAFPSSCHLQPGLSGVVKKGYFKGFTPIFTDLMGLKPPKVGFAGNGKPLPHQSH
jgi:hypothetical protein